MKTWLLLLAIAPLWIGGNILWQLDLPADLEGRDLILNGYIADLPKAFDPSGSSFVFDVTTAHDKTQLIKFSGRVKLTWYKDAPPLKASERWQMVARLKARHSSMNPGGFNYETFLFRSDIRATGYVRNPQQSHRLAPATISILSLRETLRERLRSQLPQHSGSGLVLALTLGDTSGIESRAWKTLRRTSTIHLVSVSGLHLTFIGGWGFWLIKSLWQRSATLCLRVAPVQIAAASGGLLLAWGYAMLASLSSVPSWRSLGAFVFLQFAILLRRMVRFIDSFIVALLLILFIDPLAILSSSFWLSFGALAGLIYGMSGRLNTRGIIWQWLRAQWIVFIWLAPLLAFLFNQISIIAIPINSIVIPLFEILLPLLLITVAIAFFSNWFWPVQILAEIFNQLFIYLEYVADWSWASVPVPLLPWWTWFLAFPAAVLLTAPRGLPGRWVGILLLLPIFLWQPLTPPPGAVRFNLLDVGQGLAAIIQTHNHCLVYDTGPALGNDLDAGASIVAPTLMAHGIAHIDTLIVSHADNDHAGGVSGLLEQIPATEILSGEPAKLTQILAKQIFSGELSALAIPGVRQCEAGQSWTWDGVQFSILYPRLPLFAESNNRSCVLQIHSHNNSLLITGDLNQTAEKSLIAIFGEQISSAVLIAGHHGSKTSTSRELLESVKPKWVLISAGYRNRFGFPRPQTVARILYSGAKIANTATAGALEIWLDADGNMRGPFFYRKLNAYPWTHMPLD